jgi:Bacterial Ig domain
VTAGDTGGTSVPATATAPEAAPAAPTGVSVSPNGTAVRGQAEPGATVTVKAADGTTVLGTAVADGTGAFTVPLSPAQTHGETLDVTAADAGGSSADASVIAPTTVIVESPTLLATQALDGVNNLDVKSALVLGFSDNIVLGNGKITVHDDMGSSGWTIMNATTGESVQDIYANDVVITLTDGAVTGLVIGGVDKTSEAAGSVTVSGNKLIIDPAGLDSASNTDWDFDWDFGANYHVSLDAGVVKSASGLGNAAIDGASNLNFSTVAPADAPAGAASQALNSTSGALESGYTYHNAHVSKVGATAVALNFSTGKHALVFQDAGADPIPSADKHVTTIGGYVSLSGFSADDLLYLDNMGNVSQATGEGSKGAQWLNDSNLKTTVDPTQAQLIRQMSNMDGGTVEQVLFADYAPSIRITSLFGADKQFEDANHWNANVVIYA